MPTRAVLFDFDGVLADTENIHVVAWERTFAEMGWTVGEEVCGRSVEVDDGRFLAEVFAGREIEDGDVEGWVTRKQRLTRSMLADSPRIYPGVANLVEQLKDRVRLAVVSTTWRENIEVVLGASGLLDAFGVVIAKEDVAAVKPDPECYQRALERLAVSPREAVAIEDSVTGLEAARGAGLRALAVGHRRPKGNWVGPSEFIGDLADPSAVLTTLGLA